MDDGSDQVEELTLESEGGARAGRRRALWGVLAAVAVAAGALVIIAAGDDDSAPPGLPVVLGAARAEAGAAADAMLAPVTYVAGDDLPVLGGEATAYRLATTVTEDQVRTLADALGLTGPVAHDGPSWTVDDEGSGHLEVYEDGAAQWWYSSTSGAVSGGGSSSGSAGVDACSEQTDDVITDCLVVGTPSIPTTSVPGCTASDGASECVTGTCDDTGDCSIKPPVTIECGPGADCAPAPPPDCAVTSDAPDQCVDVEPPAPVADLPSEDEARAIALDLLTATGVDVDGAVVHVDGGYDAWFVSVEPRLDGVPSGLLSSVSVGPGEVVTMASGSLADPDSLGTYPLLDTRAAIDRANADVATDLPAIASDSGSAAAGSSPAVSCPAHVAAEDCGDQLDPGAVTTMPCAEQPDGREICQTDATARPCENVAAVDASDDDGVVCDLPGCPQAVPPVDAPLEDPATIDCGPTLPDPGGVPAPAPDGGMEVVLVDAEPALVVLAAIDGSTDGYLVPAYRFTDADGGVVDLPAVADAALTTPPTTDTSAVTPPPTDTVVEPQPCNTLVEEDASGTTITVQSDPDCVAPDPVPLAAGEQPEIGVGYYVDVDTTCEALDLGGTKWILDEGDVSGWADPGERHEGGAFTLDAPAHGTFVGDHQGTKTATFRLPAATEQVANCDPVPRR